MAEDGRVFLQIAYAFFGLTLVCALSGVSFGNTEALGFLVDSEVAVGLQAFCLSRLPESDRQATLPIVCGVMVVNCLVSFGEWATHLRLMPYKFSLTTGETIFRATGFLNHPLINGLYTCATIPFIMLLRIPLFGRYLMVGLFAAATFAIETRFASLVAIPTSLVAYFLSTRSSSSGSDNQSSRFLQIIMGLVFAPLAVVLGLAGGFGERIASGLIDGSSQSRLSVYSLLDYLSLRELLTGVGSVRAGLIIAVRQGLIIESPVVQLIFLFGIPLMLLFFTTVFWSFYRLARGANLFVWLGIATFFVVAASNSGLASKNPELVFLMMFVAGARGRTRAAMTASLPAQSEMTNVVGRARVLAHQARMSRNHSM